MQRLRAQSRLQSCLWNYVFQLIILHTFDLIIDNLAFFRSSSVSPTATPICDDNYSVGEHVHGHCL